MRGRTGIRVRARSSIENLNEMAKVLLVNDEEEADRVPTRHKTLIPRVAYQKMFRFLGPFEGGGFLAAVWISPPGIFAMRLVVRAMQFPAQSLVKIKIE